MSVTVLPRISEARVAVTRYYMLALLQILDVATTWYILTSWSKSAERNPLIKSIIDTVGIDRGLFIILLFKLGVVALFYYCQTGVKLASAIYSLVIINNVLFLALYLFG